MTETWKTRCNVRDKGYLIGKEENQSELFKIHFTLQKKSRHKKIEDRANCFWIVDRIETQTLHLFRNSIYPDWLNLSFSKKNKKKEATFTETKEAYKNIKTIIDRKTPDVGLEDMSPTVKSRKCTIELTTLAYIYKWKKANNYKCQSQES